MAGKNVIRFNGGLSASLSGNWIMADKPLDKRIKQYFEVYVSANNYVHFGLIDKNATWKNNATSDVIAASANGYYGRSYAYMSKKWNDIVNDIFPNTPPNGKIYGIAASEDTFAIYYSGLLLKEYDLADLGLSIDYDPYPFMWCIWNYSAYFSFNFGETPLAYKPPTGYVSVYQAMNTNQLYLSNGEAFGVTQNTFTKLADDWMALSSEEKKALFESTNHEIATAADLETLGKFKVLNYLDTNYKPKLTVRAVPKDEMIFPRAFTHVESFDGIDQVMLTKTSSGNGDCKFIVTTDLKTYQTYDFEKQAWNPIDHTDLVLVKQSGIDAAQFTAISKNAWDKLLKGKAGLGIAYLLSIESTADKCQIDKIAAQVDIKGNWAK